ncbi:MAG TPA: AMP-dependent synthetase/ligase [Gaiellaceae bacterium]
MSAATVCELFDATASRHADRDALRTRGGEVTITWREYAQRVRGIAAGLAALGVKRGDTLALMLANRPEFHLVDTAALHLGAVPFSLYNSSSPKQIAYLLEDAAPRIVVTERAFADVIPRSASIKHVVVVDGTPSLSDLERRGARDFDFEAAWHAVEPSDLLTLIYTSGTTGPPKGVQITHGNYLAELRAFDSLGGLEAGRVVSYFPMAHIAERVISHYHAVACGHTVTCCPDARQLTAYLPEVRPTFFFAVPRIWEKLKAALEAEVVTVERLGLGEARHILTGAAPTPVDVLEFFRARGIEILEVYGLSETTGLATANPPGRARLGTVGLPAAGVELRLADDGEVLVRGGIVTAGYRNDPERTAEVFGADGWFRTGDVGELDDDGYLRIVDRKKELIINAAGENMSPANIEAQLKSSSPLIGQACVIGDRRPYNVALIVLDPDGATAFAGDRPLAELAHDTAVTEEVASGVERANAHLSRPEQIKRFCVLDADWEAAGDELTPTLKLKRRPVEQKYAEAIEALYAEGPGAGG